MSTITLYQNPCAGQQHETDDQGMPWWSEPVEESASASQTPESNLEDAWGDCPECGADTFLGQCVYCSDHWHVGRCAY